jgi:transposase
MTAAYMPNDTTQSLALHLAFELSWTHWKLAFTTGHGQQARQRTIRARDLAALEQEIGRAKKRFKLDPDTLVFSCYEAGRDGFWLHRYLMKRGIVNVIVDSASIEVNRRKRRAKSDKLDAHKLVSMLLRYHAGERKVWSVVRVPGVADEDNRQLHRDLQELLDERDWGRASLIWDKSNQLCPHLPSGLGNPRAWLHYMPTQTWAWHPIPRSRLEETLAIPRRRLPAERVQRVLQSHTHDLDSLGIVRAQTQVRRYRNMIVAGEWAGRRLGHGIVTHQ